MSSSPSDLLVSLTDLSDLDENEELLQTGYWGRFKQMFGWRAQAFRLGSGNVLLLSRTLAPGLSLAYVPLGPQWPEPEPGQREQRLVELADRMAAFDKRIFVVRYDLPWFTEGQGNPPPALWATPRLKKSLVDIQPPNTVLLDLAPEEDDLLAGMKSKTRYNIRLAAKKGVTVQEAGVEGLASWYRLHEETGLRDRIVHHSLLYYQKLFELAETYGKHAPGLKLLMAEHEGEAVAGIIVAFGKTRAWYLYGASADKKRNLMAGYALQWRAIRLARERGCRSYDFFGIPPRLDPDHPMAGLYRFKTGFGGTVVNRCGCWDAVTRPFAYALYRGAEKARRFYYMKLRKTVLHPPLRS